MANKHKQKSKKKVKPDEVVTNGPFQMARIGNQVHLRNAMNKEQHDKFIAELAPKYGDLCKSIDEVIQEIRTIIQVTNPLQLLHRAYGESVAGGIGKTSEFEMNNDDITRHRMIDYVQSIIVSSQPIENQNLTDETWEQLRKKVEKLYRILSLEYHLVETAHKKINGVDMDLDYEEFYVKAQMFWLSVRGERYVFHDAIHLHDLLIQHNSIFIDLFGITVKKFLDGIKELEKSLIFGIFDAGKDLKELHSKFANQFDISQANMDNEVSEIIDEFFKKNGLEAEKDDAFSRFFGLDLFDVAKVTDIPVALLRELAWEPGENQEFFAPGEKSGWPLKILPVNQRPFLKIDDKYYCFDLYSLKDNLYKAMRRIILRLKPSYQQTWNAIQKDVTEKLPIELFCKILTGATAYNEVYYKWHVGKNGRLEWCENDGIILYDDHLIVLEVKGGAFTYTSPMDDFGAFIQSIHNLAIKPAEQGIRFVEYIKSADEVGIYDKSRTLLTTLKGKQIRHITICCVSLDNFTTFAARIGNLKALGLEIAQPIWSISIDDIRVYADLFTSGTQFTHFLEERSEACFAPKLDLDDELDHYGMYMHNNRYTRLASGANCPSSTRLVWNGFRQGIDTYYHNLLGNPSAAVLPTQALPELFKDIIRQIDTQMKPGRCAAVSHLLDIPIENRDIIAKRINEMLVLQKTEGRMKSISTTFTPRITFFCKQPGVTPMLKNEMDDFILSNIVLTEEQLFLGIYLEFDNDDLLKNIDFEFFSESGICDNEMIVLRQMANNLAKARVRKALAKGPIGPNEQCPCGRGRKYKKCCEVR